MKRRGLLLGSAALIGSPLIGKFDCARAADAPDPSRLNKDLTPLGAERAASADGLVPEWKGGVSSPPAGWSRGMLPPDLFGNEKPLFSVTPSNVSKYADMLCDGQKIMLSRFGKRGYRMDVYPSHRTACAPQWMYDNTAKNVTRARPAVSGIEHGIQGALGGVPFPILSDDKALAGAQAIWNHLLRWQGPAYNAVQCSYVVGNNQRALASALDNYQNFPYYDQNMTPHAFDARPIYERGYLATLAPPNQVGGKVMVFYSANLDVVPDTAYEYLTGEGRIRQLPATEYDIPATQLADAINYDETFLYEGAPNRYKWKLLGKKEMIIPYNQRALGMSQPNDVMGLEFVNPDLTRFEVHRCWVVEARLAPGARMTEPVRRFYLDEDTWVATLAESYDDQGNLWKFGENLNEVHPDLPGTVWTGTVIYNFQSNEYALVQVYYKAPRPLASAAYNYARLPGTMFQPQSMANSGGL